MWIAKLGEWPKNRWPKNEDPGSKNLNPIIFSYFNTKWTKWSKKKSILTDKSYGMTYDTTLQRRCRIKCGFSTIRYLESDSYSETLAKVIWSVKACHCRWPWVSSKGHFSHWKLFQHQYISRNTAHIIQHDEKRIQCLSNAS